MVNNGWSAESGGASGGAINVVTKSGANLLHGDAFLFGQSGALDAAPAFGSPQNGKPSLARSRGGLALGGPIVRDRMFYYAAVEREHTRGQDSSDRDRQDAAAINAKLASGAFPVFGTTQLTTGFHPTSLDETEASGKISRQLAGGGSVMARVAVTDRYGSADAFNTGALTDLSARGTSAARDVALTGTGTSILAVTSGATVNPIVGADVSRNDAFPSTDRPAGYGGNSSRLPASAALDLRVLKYFDIKPHGKLDLVVEAFNFLNRVNVSEINFEF